VNKGKLRKERGLVPLKKERRKEKIYFKELHKREIAGVKKRKESKKYSWEREKTPQRLQGGEGKNFIRKE